MILDLYLFRHGETEYNATNELIGGQSNHLALSERGERQAKALGERLSSEGIKFDFLFSSTAERAKQTAKIVCEVIGFPSKKIITAPELLEISQGEWEGKKRTETMTEEILAQMKEQHWEFKAPGGESQKDVEERAFSWLKKNLLAKKENLTVGIFSHGVTTKCILRRILNSNPQLTYRICINNCSITRVKYAHVGLHEGWSLIKVNDDVHLAGPGFSQASFV